MLLPLQGDRGVDGSERRELELRTVNEERGAVREVRERRGRREAGVGVSPAQLVLMIGCGELQSTQRVPRFRHATVAAKGCCIEYGRPAEPPIVGLGAEGTIPRRMRWK